MDEGERMQKPSGSGFGAGGGSYAELSMLERKENVRGSERGRSGRPSKGGAEGCVFILHIRVIYRMFQKPCSISICFYKCVCVLRRKATSTD